MVTCFPNNIIIFIKTFEKYFKLSNIIFIKQEKQSVLSFISDQRSLDILEILILYLPPFLPAFPGIIIRYILNKISYI